MTLLAVLPRLPTNNLKGLGATLTVHVRIEELKPLGQQTRRHAKSQIGKLAASLQEFGFVLPIVVDAKRRVVSGWALVAAAQHRPFPTAHGGCTAGRG